MDITLQFSTLAEAVNRSLAITAKRLRNADGKSVYDDITLSTAEQPLLYDYFREAIVLLNTTTQHFITDTLFSDEMETPSVTLTFPNNHNNAMNTTITVALTSFCVAYAVYAWLSVVNPGIVKRYEEAMQEKLDALVQLIFHKAPPQSSYTYDLPPVVNTPGDITLSSGGQYLLGYTLGSDGVDDLVATSSSEAIVVTKVPNNRLFSIYNGNVGENNITGTVTIKRSDNSVLATINVTAKAPAADAAIVTHPALIGYSALSDTITLRKGANINIYFTGNITSITANNDNVSYTLTDSPTKVINIQGDEVGTSVVTIYDNAGWRYTLYVTVEAVVGVSPYFTSPQHVGIDVGETTYITYNLGDETLDDFYVAESRGNITITKDAANRRFVVTGISAGGGYVRVQSSRHPESNTVFMFVVNSTDEAQLPDVYGYTSGDTINMVAGASPVRIYFFPGSEGTFDISPSVVGKVSLSEYDGMGYVDVTPLEAGNITLTFANQGMIVDEQNDTSWSFTLTIAVAARPAVVTNPIVYFPDRVEGFYKDDVRRYDYVLGNDNTDNLTVTSSNQNVATVDIDRTNKKIVITAQSASDGTATITVSKPNTGWSQSVVVYVDESYEVIAPKINYYQIHGSSAVNISSGQTSASVSVEGKRIYVNASMGRKKNGSVIYTRIVSSDQTVIAVTDQVYTGTISLIPVSEGSATVSFYNSDTNALIFALGVTVTEATEDAGVPVINGLAIVGGTFSTNPSENESYIAIPSDSTSYNVYLPLDKYLLLDIDDTAAEVSITSDNDSIAEYELMGGGRGVAGNDMIVPHAVGSTVIRFTSPGLSWSFNLNVAVVGTSSEGGSNTPASLPEITSSSHDGTYYLKGTVDGVTNPVFMHDSLGTGVVVIHKTNNNEIYCYNESAGTVSIDTVHTLSDVSTLGQAIVNALTTYGVAAATYTTTTSQPDSPVGYALYSPASSGGSSSGTEDWSGLTLCEDSSDFVDGEVYVLKGYIQDSQYTNLRNYIFRYNNGKVAAVSSGNGNRLYYFDASNQQIKQEYFSNVYDMEDAAWYIVTAVANALNTIGMTVTADEVNGTPIRTQTVTSVTKYVEQ
jgi:hypothetical protein